MKKALSALLSCSLALQLLPLCPVSAETDPLWEKFLRYDLCITDYDALPEDEKQLCHFIFETEQNGVGTVRAERARRILAHDPNVGERLTEEKFEKAYGVCDWYSGSQLDDHTFLHCVPDVKYLDDYGDLNEYWVDDERSAFFHCMGENSMSNRVPVFYKNGVEPVYPNTNYPPYFDWNYRNDGTWRYEALYLEDPNFVEIDGDYYCILPDQTAVLYTTRYRQPEGHPTWQKKLIEPITVPDEVNGCPVVAINSNAFAYSSITEVILPESIQYIHAKAFKGCQSLRKINIPEDIKLIGAGAFSETAITEVKINSPDMVLSPDAFWLCPALERADLNVRVIGERAFSNCSKLKTVTLGDAVEKIEMDAFCDTALKTVSLPKSLRAIGINALNTVEQVELKPTVEILGALPRHRGSDPSGFGISAQPVLPLETPDKCVFNCDCVGEDCVISGYKKSEAARYANEWGLRFVPLDAVYGDVNDDGALSIADAVLLAKYLSGAAGVALTDWKSADLNNNRRLDAVDLTLLLREISRANGKTETVPAETTATTTAAATTVQTTVTTTAKTVLTTNATETGTGTTGST